MGKRVNGRGKSDQETRGGHTSEINTTSASITVQCWVQNPHFSALNMKITQPQKKKKRKEKDPIVRTRFFLSVNFHNGLKNFWENGERLEERF